jgi:hypothetical protein
MQEVDQQNALSGKRVLKSELKMRYLVGARTIEAWQAKGIIRGVLEKGKWTFDVEDCDRMLFKRSSDEKSKNRKKEDFPPMARTE